MAFVVLKLLMFKVCCISKIEVFNISGTERANNSNNSNNNNNNNNNNDNNNNNNNNNNHSKEGCNSYVVI